MPVAPRRRLRLACTSRALLDLSRCGGRFWHALWLRPASEAQAQLLAPWLCDRRQAVRILTLHTARAGRGPTMLLLGVLAGGPLEALRWSAPAVLGCVGDWALSSLPALRELELECGPAKAEAGTATLALTPAFSRLTALRSLTVRSFCLDWARGSLPAGLASLALERCAPPQSSSASALLAVVAAAACKATALSSLALLTEDSHRDAEELQLDALSALAGALTHLRLSADFVASLPPLGTLAQLQRLELELGAVTTSEAEQARQHPLAPLAALRALTALRLRYRHDLPGTLDPLWDIPRLQARRWAGGGV